MTETNTNQKKTNDVNTSKTSCCNTNQTCTMLSPLMTGQGKAIMHIVGIVLLVILIVLNTITLKNTSNLQEQVLAALEQVEAMKVGGEENYEIMKEIYTSETFATQQKQGLQNALQNIQQGGGNTQAPQQQAEPSGEISTEQVEQAIEGVSFQGDENASLVLLEYSDFLCPFCQRHHQAGTIDKVREAFPGEIKTAFITNTRGNPSSMQISNAAECAAEQNAYKEFVDAMFAQGPAVSAINDVAEQIGIAGEPFQTCVDEGRYQEKISEKMRQASQWFGANGTPGNVLLDLETGEYLLISGAQPVDVFISAIEQFKQN